MLSLQNELMRLAEAALEERKKVGDEKIGGGLFEEASEKEMAL